MKDSQNKILRYVFFVKYYFLHKITLCMYENVLNKFSYCLQYRHAQELYN